MLPLLQLRGPVRLPAGLPASTILRTVDHRRTIPYESRDIMQAESGERVIQDPVLRNFVVRQ